MIGKKTAQKGERLLGGLRLEKTISAQKFPPFSVLPGRLTSIRLEINPTRWDDPSSP